MEPGPATRDVVVSRLAGTRFGDVRWFERIDSTNRYLLDAAARDEPEGVVAVADEQTAGRGRRGRRWLAPPGSSLLVSVLLRPDLVPEELHLVTAAAAVSAAEAVGRATGAEVRVKWPNDLVVEDRKLAGLLAESRVGSGGPAVVVGLGVNVAWDVLPEDLADRATACNLVSDRPVSREGLLVEWLVGFDELLAGLGTAAGRAAVRQRWRELSATLGRRVRVELPTGTFEGVAAALTAAGHLLVATDAGEVEVSVGDVVHLRPVDEA